MPCCCAFSCQASLQIFLPASVIGFILPNILKKVVWRIHTKSHDFSEPTFPVLKLLGRDMKKTLYNLSKIGTDLDSPSPSITLLIQARQPSEKCWWSWRWTNMFFQLTAFDWRHSWPYNSFSGQNFCMQSNKYNLWSESNVTILSQLFHPYAIIFQHFCAVQNGTWMVSNRFVIVIWIMTQLRALISTVGKKAAGSMEKPIKTKNAPKIKSCKSKINPLSPLIPYIILSYDHNSWRNSIAY